MTGWGIRLPKWGLDAVPATLWAYVALALAHSLLWNALGFSERPWGPALLPLEIVFSYLLLRGFRVFWWLAVISLGLDLLTAPFLGLPWWRILLEVVYLALLVAPPSRRYVLARGTGGDDDETTQVSRDPDSVPDPGRSAGWHVDPGNPLRMRYWNPELGEWRGRARTPRKIRKAWEEGRRPDP